MCIDFCRTVQTTKTLGSLNSNLFWHTSRLLLYARVGQSPHDIDCTDFELIVAESTPAKVLQNERAFGNRSGWVSVAVLDWKQGVRNIESNH